MWRASVRSSIPTISYIPDNSARRPTPGGYLKALEDENRRLKKLLAESMLDASTLKEMLGKNF
jgi:putative transposase